MTRIEDGVTSASWRESSESLGLRVAETARRLGRREKSEFPFPGHPARRAPGRAAAIIRVIHPSHHLAIRVVISLPESLIRVIILHALPVPAARRLTRESAT